MPVDPPFPPDAERTYREYLTAIVLHGQAVADAMGISATEAYAMNLIGVHGSMTAGRLAAHTGLTSGAATRLIDRLVRAGLARRAPDPGDRRRVLVESVPDRPPGEAGAVVERARERMAELFAGYDRDQLTLLFDFFARSAAVYRDALAEGSAPAGSGVGPT